MRTLISKAGSAGAEAHSAHLGCLNSKHPIGGDGARVRNSGPTRQREITDVVSELFTILCTHLGDSLSAAASGPALKLARNENVTYPTRSRDSVVDLVRALLEAKEADGLSVRYLQTLRTHLQRFGTAFDREVSSIAVGDIEHWLRSLAVANRTRNNIRGSILTLFHFARKHGYLPKGVPTEADEIAKAKERGGKIGILTPSDLSLAIMRAPQRARLFFALGAFAGLRSSEILRLDWSEINLDRQVITVAPEKTKTATRRLVPIQPNLNCWLKPYRVDTGPLLTRRREIDDAIRFAKACGLEWPNNGLRHSYATYRLALTADAARVALEMGNSPHKLIRHYRELADDRDAAAWFAICPDE